MVGGWFKNLANALPFAHAVNAARDAISGNYSDIMPELIPVCGYAVVLLVLAVVVFSVMMKRNKQKILSSRLSAWNFNRQYGCVSLMLRYFYDVRT